MENTIDLCIKSYEKEKNIKKVGDITGIKWQTVYWYLKKAGVSVCGDKSRYGSKTDKFAYIGEKYVENLIPNSINQNSIMFQPKIDFIINTYRVDVKSSKLVEKDNRWAFSIKKQMRVSDYFILLAYDTDGNNVIAHFVLPTEMLLKSIQTISIPKNYNHSKWGDFFISKEDLKIFFDN